MRIVIDNKLYFKSINVSSKTSKLTKFREKLFNVISKVWPWALTLVMFLGLAVLGLRCF